MVALLGGFHLYLFPKTVYKVLDMAHIMFNVRVENATLFNTPRGKMAYSSTEGVV
jgi:hypothetical protein